MIFRYPKLHSESPPSRWRREKRMGGRPLGWIAKAVFNGSRFLAAHVSPLRGAIAGCLLVLGACACTDNDSAHDDGGGGADGFGGSGDEAADLCCELGALCHQTEEHVDEEVRRCHQLGHTSDAALCAEEYEYCKSVCAGVTDHPMPHGCK